MEEIGTRQEVASPTKAHILIVDDEAATLRSLKHRYRRSYKVHTAATKTWNGRRQYTAAGKLYE